MGMPKLEAVVVPDPDLEIEPSLRLRQACMCAVSFYYYSMIDDRYKVQQAKEIQKAREKDTWGKRIEEGYSSNLVHEKNPQYSHKKKFKLNVKPREAITFKNKVQEKGKGDCFLCRKPSHWVKYFP
uniref:Uncharacterized protein n=1 Tax=Oryza brachyantha TaxID=4533 RepID=J3MDT8_ORYBR